MEKGYCLDSCIFNLPFVPSIVIPRCDYCFILEAPGKDEIAWGIPCVGDAGQQMDRLLNQARIIRNEISILNTCCCVDLKREDRRPLPAEKEACRPRLMNEIVTCQPKVIIAMGGVAHSTFAPGQSVSSLVGKARAFTLEGQVYPVVFTYHPARSLPFSNPEIAPVIVRNLEYAREIAGL